MRSLLSAAAILVLSLFLCGASPEGNGAQGQQQDSQQAAAQTLQTIAATLKAQGGGDIAKAPCAQNEDNRNSELCAEWKSADAAYRSAYWAPRSFWVGFLTLMAAATAAGFAWLAAHHTRRSADYASDSHQAFVRVEDASLIVTFSTGRIVTGSDPAYCALEAQVTNVGRSAARIHAFMVAGDDAAIIEKTLADGATQDLPRVHIPMTGRATAFEATVIYSTALTKSATLTLDCRALENVGGSGQAMGMVFDHHLTRSEAQAIYPSFRAPDEQAET